MYTYGFCYGNLTDDKLREKLLETACWIRENRVYPTVSDEEILKVQVRYGVWAPGPLNFRTNLATFTSEKDDTVRRFRDLVLVAVEHRYISTVFGSETFNDKDLAAIFTQYYTLREAVKSAIKVIKNLAPSPKAASLRVELQRLVRRFWLP